MSETLDKIKQLVIADKIRVSQHAFRRLASHSIRSDDLVASVVNAVVLEDCPAYYAPLSLCYTTLPMELRFMRCGASKRELRSRRC